MELKSFDEVSFSIDQEEGSLVLLQFWSSWCGPCFDIKHLEEFQEENPSIKVYRVNTEENQTFCKNYSIVILPTYLFLKNSKELARFVGLQTKDSLKGFNEQTSYFKI